MCILQSEERFTEYKSVICEELCNLLASTKTYSHIVDIEYIKRGSCEEIANCVFRDVYEYGDEINIPINITFDLGIAIIRDVLKGLEAHLE